VLDLGLLALVVCVGAVVLGALVQGTVGFGIALVSAPVLLMVDPRLVPPAMLVVSSAMPWTTLVQEWRHIDWYGLKWSLAGRVVGTAIGVWVVGALGADGVSVAIAVMVLLAVAVSVSGLHMPLNRRNLVLAGVLGGTGGTASGIGGPPLAVLYSGQSGPAIRSTLAAFFAAGQALSLVSLLGAGVVDGRAALTGLALLPGVLIGALLARRLRRYLHPQLLRPAVLGLASISAVVLLVRVVL
jgi:uncharacterized membrane protein YfcA